MGQVNFRIGGVPEHFNLPIHFGIENGDFQKKGISLSWTDYPGGTGHMTKALRDGQLDIAILLTEGIITDIVKGNQSKIISEYVISPLTWGIHTGNKNSVNHINEIFDKKHAISRIGSGSHLMAIVNANTQGQNMNSDQFTVVDNLSNALESLDSLKTDVFYWEKYTTKPYVDAGKIRRIGEYLTPWPCFVIAARESVIEHYPEELSVLLDLIHSQTMRFMHDDSVMKIASERFQQKLEDIERWYHTTEWASDSWVSDKMIKSVIYHLQTAGILKPDVVIPDLIWRKD